MPMGSAMRWGVGAGLLLAVAAAGYGIWSYQLRSRGVGHASQHSPAEDSPPAGVSRELYEEAKLAFFTRYHRVPSELDVLSYAAELAQSRQDYETAAAYFQKIPSDHPQYGHLARYQQGFCLLKLERASEAEAQFREFLQLEARDPQATPGHVQDAMQRLRYILEVELRFHERHELLKIMHERGLAETFDTMVYCFPSLLRWNGPQAVDWCEGFWETDPEDPLICAALARYRVGQGRMQEAQALLESIPNKQADRPEVFAAWLYLHSQNGNWEAMEEIVQQLPPPTPDEPWLLLQLRGQVHNRANRFKQAETCFRYVLQSDPANAPACQGLIQTYAGLGRVEDRKALLRKAEVLARIQNRLGWVEEDEQAQRPLREIAKLCRQIALDKQAELIDQLLARIEASPPEMPSDPSKTQTPEPHQGAAE